MDKLVIQGGTALHGTIPVSGAKNAALPILISTLVSPGTHYFENVPDLVDINSTLSLLGRIGCPSLKKANDNGVGQKIQLDTSRIAFSEAPYDVVRKMRASVLVLGPLLARCGSARVSLPGGCAIGVRPIDQHLKGLEALGCSFDLVGGYIEGKVDHLKGSEVNLSMPTVTGTENILMAAVLADGVTTINNAAREPEIVNLADFLRQMGARIQGDGTSTIEVDGVPALRPSRSPFAIMGDRIEAGTYLLMGAISKGDVTLTNAPVESLKVILARLKDAGLGVESGADWVRVFWQGKLNPVSIETTPYPGFPTDMQAQWMTLMTQANASSSISERIFENRFMHVAELHRLGARVDINGSVAHVRGEDSLFGATVMATDLRASASLVMAGLAAEGLTEVLRIYHLDRGYESLIQKIRSVGGKIVRVPSNKNVESID